MAWTSARLGRLALATAVHLAVAVAIPAWGQSPGYPQQPGPYGNQQQFPPGFYGGGGQPQQGPSGGGQMPPGQFGGGQMLPGQFGGGQMPPGQFGGGQMPPGQFGGGQMPPGQFGGGQMPPGQFGGGQMPPGQFGGGQMPPGQFGGGQMPPGQFGGGQMPPGQFGGGQMPPGQFGGGQTPPGQFGGGQAPQAQSGLNQQMLQQLGQAERQDFGIPPTAELHGGALHGPTPSSIPGAQVVTTLGLVSLLSQSGASVVVLDALGGQARLPNAVPVAFAAQPGSFDDQVQQQLAQALMQATRGDRSRPIVVYCSDPHCWMSYNVALRVANLRYQNVLWYRGGLWAWQQAQLPVQGG